MTRDRACHCEENAVLTREDAAEEAMDLIRRGAEHADVGRVNEASAFNGLAQTAMALSVMLPSAYRNPGEPIH